MKKTMKLRMSFVVCSLFGLLCLTSCNDYLDTEKYFKDRLTMEKAFAEKPYVEQWLAHAYSFLLVQNGDVCNFSEDPHNFADDIYYGASAGYHNEKVVSYANFKNGRYNEDDYNENWAMCYKGIRQASEFLKYIKYNKDLTADEIEDYKGQAYFLRGYLYWLLLRKYGPVPIIETPDGELDYTQSDAALSSPRNTYDECVDYICQQMIEAAKRLPLKRDALNIARPTRGAALATRAKALLYAASPLMNGNKDNYAKQLTDDKGRQLLNAEYNEEKWAKAAAACKDVIDLGVYEIYVTGTNMVGTSDFPKTITPPYNAEFSNKEWPNGWANIDPYLSYRAVFDGELIGSSNPEIIFTRGTNGNNQTTRGLLWMIYYMLPKFAGGFNTIGATQKQVDAYYMNDGTDVPGKDKEIGRGDGSERPAGFTTSQDVKEGKYAPLCADVSLQYANREPRFYATIAYNGCFWPLSNAKQADHRNYYSWYYRGGHNGFDEGYNNGEDWLRTGIGFRKYVHPFDTNDANSYEEKVFKTEPAIRYADILLMYAEALNELTKGYQVASWDASKTYDISRSIDEIKKGIRPIRIRAGLPDYSDDTYGDAARLRAKIKRERQIELVGEGQRYYDLRRWKDAPVEESLPIYGCNVMMTYQQKELFHSPVVVTQFPTTFSDKMYFWPLPKSELKRNLRLTQNPGWQTYD